MDWKYVTSFLRMVRGASQADCYFLLNFGILYKRVYVLDLEAKSVGHADGRIQWPIIWLLARFHKKHILCSKTRPNINLIRGQLAQFGHKIKWRFHYRHDNTPPSRR